MFRFQFRRMVQSLGFKIAFSFMIGFCMFSLAKELFEYRYTDVSAVPDANVLYCGFGITNCWTYFTVFFPFLMVLPFATSFISDTQSHAISLIWTRSSVSRYLLSKLSVSFLGGVITVGIPFLLNLLLCNIVLPHNHNVLFGEYALQNYYGMLTGSNQLYTSVSPGIFFLELYLKSPFLYNLFFLCILSLAAGLMSAVLMALSFIIKKRKIVLFFPFFIFWYLSKNITELIYSNAIENSEVLFRNFTYTDYLAPMTFGGLMPNYLFILTGIFLLFIILAFLYAVCNPLKYIQEG